MDTVICNPKNNLSHLSDDNRLGRVPRPYVVAAQIPGLVDTYIRPIYEMENRAVNEKIENKVCVCTIGGYMYCCASLPPSRAIFLFFLLFSIVVCLLFT